MTLRSPYSPDPDVRKIAVLRANAVGDFIVTLPALEALRAAYPEAEIVLLGRRWHAEFLQDRPGPVDRVVTVPPYPGVGAPEDAEVDRHQLNTFFAAMQAERFSLAVQLHGGGKNSNPFVQRLGARLSVGLRAEDAPPLDRWIPYMYFQPEIVRYLEVVSLAGATEASIEPRVAVLDTDLGEAAPVVPLADRPLVALHPGATDPRRRWPVTKFGAVGDRLAAEGAVVVITGTEEERSLVDGVARHMRAPALPLAGRLSLGGLAGLLSRCRVVVSNDSGPRHLAEAVGVRTVGIYHCFNLVNVAPLRRAYSRAAVSWRLACPVCGRDSVTDGCSHTASFVADVPVEEVVTAALDLFNQEGPGPV